MNVDILIWVSAPNKPCQSISKKMESFGFGFLVGDIISEVGFWPFCLRLPGPDISLCGEITVSNLTWCPAYVKSDRGAWSATVRSFAHMPLGLSVRNKMVLWPGCEGRAVWKPSPKERVIGAVRCKKEGTLLQTLCWHCAECVFHHIRNVYEEQHHIYVAWTSNNRAVVACNLCQY